MKDWEKETWITEKKPSGVCGRPSCLSRRRSSGRAAATWTPSSGNTGTRRAFLPRFSSPDASMRWVIPNASALRCCGERRPTPPTANVPGRVCCIFWNSCCPKDTSRSGPWRRCWAAGPAAGSPLQWSSSGKCKQEPGAQHRAPALTYRDYSSSWGLSSSSRPFRSNSSFSPQLGQMTSPSSRTDSSK